MADVNNLGLGSDNPYLGQNNPYLEQIIASTTKDMTDAYGRTVVPAQNRAALQSGSFGNSGLDEMQRADQAQLQKSIADSSAKTRFNDYTQQQSMYQWDRNAQIGQNQFDDQFGRSIFNDAYAQNNQNLQTGIGLLDRLGQVNSADAATAQGLYDAPFKYLTQFSGLANGLGGKGGTTTSTEGTTSSPVATALGGAQLGSSFSDWWNSKKTTSGDTSGGWWA